MKFERPTVSSQNGLPIWRLISFDKAASMIEKKGLGSAGGSGALGQKLDVDLQPLLGDPRQEIVVLAGPDRRDEDRRLPRSLASRLWKAAW